MKKFGISIFIFLAIAIISNGQNRFVLEGTIGKYPIIIMIENGSNGGASAIYFYKKHRHDIELPGLDQFPELNTLFFKKERHDSKTKTETIVESLGIQKDGKATSNVWQGKWKDENGNILPVSLKPIDTSKYDFSQVPDLVFDNNEDRIFNKARLSGLTFINDSITRSGEYELQWMHEPETKISSFEIRKGYTDTILRKVNTIVRKKYFADIQSYFSCTGRHGEEGEYFSSINGYFLSPEFISVRAWASSDCGGTHPGAGDDSFTIDALNGTEIRDLDELFLFTGKKPLTEKDDKYDDYIDERANAIVTILTKLYPAEMKKPDDKDNYCDYSNPSHWKYPTWFFTKLGLYIGASFPHAAAACGSPGFSIIPYSVLAKYWHKAKN